jgi:hypothetical protein
MDPERIEIARDVLQTLRKKLEQDLDQSVD